MATQVRHPIWLPSAPKPGARTFATLYAVESFARASVSSIIPIQAYDLLRDEQRVSLIYTLVALLGLSATLLMPILIERLERRRVYSIGAGLLIVGSVLLASETLAGQMAGMLSRVMGASALAVTLNLYIMDHIRKADFIPAESMRMAWSTIAWTGGPTLGVVVYEEFGIVAAHGVVVFFSLLLLVLFWYYRLGDNAAIKPGPTRSANPIANIGRFWRQPRLRLAWVIAFGRSCFWVTFFVYAPILMVATGEGRLAGGLLVSVGNAMLFTAIFWGRLGKRFGARNTMAACFAAMTATLQAAGFIGEAAPWLTGAMLLCCAFFAISLDSLGSTPFLRAVHSYERPQMTAVYRTYLDLAELLPPLAYSIVLAFFGLGSVFATLGVFTAGCGLLTWRYLPKSM